MIEYHEKDEDGQIPLPESMKPLSLKGKDSFLNVDERQLYSMCTTIRKVFNIQDPLRLYVKDFFSILDDLSIKPKKDKSTKGGQR